MKELYLAKDRNGDINGYHASVPKLDGGMWFPTDNSGSFLCAYELMQLGIDVTKFSIKHETPIKIRAVWEVCDD